MSNFKAFRRKPGKGDRIEARPYVKGEDMKGIGVQEGAQLKEGGMICRDPENPQDQWYVYEGFFNSRYEEVK